MSSGFAVPKAFISYAWEDRDHKQWVKELAVRLRLDGVELLLDKWELAPGDELAEFMETAVRGSDAVLIVSTPIYKKKSDSRTGGVGYEGSVISGELATGAARRKFIPLLRRGEWRDAAPSWLIGSVYLDFRCHGVELEDVYSELLNTLHGRRETPPPVGSPPFPERHALERSTREEERQAGTTYSSSTEYPFVLRRLLQNENTDPALVEMGREWLARTSYDDPGWPFVWNSLTNASPDDPALEEIGREWLSRISYNDPSWPHVWHALTHASPDDPGLLELGREWLARSSYDDPAWMYMWNTLMNSSPDDPALADIGREWLARTPRV